MAIPSSLHRAGQWFLNSGIQEAGGGVARYYRADLAQNNPVSTEITGYAVSTLTCLHGLTSDQRFLQHALCAAQFLTRRAWSEEQRTFPFEHGRGDGSLTYFFDNGIIVRGLLSVWRTTEELEFLQLAIACGRAMARDFAADEEFHPILKLPDKTPIARDDRWSRSPGCYQLKSALGWYELFEATGDPAFEVAYRRMLEYSLRHHEQFLPGHSDRHMVMDRLHAFCYFLEGLLPCSDDPCCGAAIRNGIRRVAEYLRDIGPDFERSDVIAQLLRMRIYAAWAGVENVDEHAAKDETARLERYQYQSADPRLDGGFSFGSKGGSLLPYVNPVSTGFALQALACWESYCTGGAPAHRHALI